MGLDSEPCPYHGTGEFVLPPAMEWYYRPHHPEYSGAARRQADTPIQFIYPQAEADDEGGTAAVRFTIAD